MSVCRSTTSGIFYLTFFFFFCADVDSLIDTEYPTFFNGSFCNELVCYIVSGDTSLVTVTATLVTRCGHGGKRSPKHLPVLLRFIFVATAYLRRGGKKKKKQQNF